MVRFSWLYSIIFLEFVGFRGLDFVSKCERFVENAHFGRVRPVAVDGGAVGKGSNDSKDCKESRVGREIHAVRRRPRRGLLAEQLPDVDTLAAGQDFKT